MGGWRDEGMEEGGKEGEGQHRVQCRPVRVQWWCCGGGGAGQHWAPCIEQTESHLSIIMSSKDVTENKDTVFIKGVSLPVQLIG